MSKGDKQIVKVGIAGLGRSGWDIHASLLRPLPDKYRIVAVFDVDKSRQKEAADEFKCKTYAKLEELVQDKDIELFVVALPSHMHARWSIEAMNAGKDVVCEKPMATKLADADKMIQVAKETGKILAVFQNRRYAPDFLKVQEVINSGKLGRIVMIKMSWNGFSRRWDWQTLKRYGGGTLNNTGPHALDQALQLFGEKDPEIFCHLEKTLTSGDADDHGKIILKAEGAPMIDLEISSACAYPQDHWLVMGTQGGLAGSTTELRWKYFDPKKLPERPVDTKPTPDRSYNREKLPWEEETWSIENDKSPGQKGFYLDLYKTLCNGAPLYITPESVRKQMEVIERCHKLSPV